MSGLTERVERALTDPVAEMGRWARFVRFQLNLWRLCARRLHENNVMAMSAALSFRTIFALVPVLVFVFLVLKSVGVIEDSKRSLRDFLEVSGFSQIAVGGEEPPTPGGGSPEPPRVFNLADQIQDMLAGVEDKLTFERLGPVGGVLLIWTALSLLTTIEHSLNRVFGAPRSRAVARKILLYWSAMTLGPVALAVAIYCGGRIVETFENAPGASWLLVPVGWASPLVIGVIVLSAIYKLLPNTRVRYPAAVGGAVVALPLWLLARWAFAMYIDQFVTRGNLYGVLGVLPLFLLWLNLSWLIFLFGAQLAYTAANLDRIQLAEEAERTLLGPTDMLAAALAVAHRFQDGHGATSLDQLAETLTLPDVSIQALMDRLIDAGLVCAVNGRRETQYTLAIPPHRIDVTRVLAVADPRGADHNIGRDPAIARAVECVHRDTRSALADRTLADLL